MWSLHVCFVNIIHLHIFVLKLYPELSKDVRVLPLSDKKCLIFLLLTVNTTELNKRRRVLSAFYKQVTSHYWPPPLLNKDDLAADQEKEGKSNVNNINILYNYLPLSPSG